MTYPLDGFDAIHASPPCQGYSVMRNLPWLKNKEYPLMIQPVRELCIASGLPYVIENVMGARYRAGMEHGIERGAYWLCGTMFGLPFYRHRLFESNVYWLKPMHPKHVRRIRAKAHRGSDVVQSGITAWSANANDAHGHASKGVALVRQAMGIDWMTGAELSQAIPPAYTLHVGDFLMRAVRPPAP